MFAIKNLQWARDTKPRTSRGWSPRAAAPRSATATAFLAAARPDIYVKGGDYTLETLNQEERKAVESGGGRIVLIPFVAGRSTTGTLAKILKL